MNYRTPRESTQAAQNNCIYSLRGLQSRSLSQYAQPPRRCAQSICERQLSQKENFHTIGSATAKSQSPLSANPVITIGSSSQYMSAPASDSCRAPTNSTSDEAEDDHIRNPYIRSVLRGAEQRWVPPSLTQASFKKDHRSPNAMQYTREAAPYLTRRDLLREWKEKMRGSLDSVNPLDHLPGGQESREKDNSVSNASHEGFFEKPLQTVSPQFPVPVLAPPLRACSGEHSMSELRREFFQRLQCLGAQQSSRKGIAADSPPPAVMDSVNAMIRKNWTNPSAATPVARAKGLSGVAGDACGTQDYDHTSTCKKNEAEDEDEEDPRAYLYSPSRENPLFCRTGAPVPPRYRQRVELCMTKVPSSVVIHASSPNRDENLNVCGNDNDCGMVTNFLIGPETVVVESDAL